MVVVFNTRRRRRRAHPLRRGRRSGRPGRPRGLGRSYLSKATCLMRPPFVLRAFRRVRDHRDLLHSSSLLKKPALCLQSAYRLPPLKKTRVRQVVWDKWFPPNMCPGSLSKESFHSHGSSLHYTGNPYMTKKTAPFTRKQYGTPWRPVAAKREAPLSCIGLWGYTVRPGGVFASRDFDIYIYIYIYTHTRLSI